MRLLHWRLFHRHRPETLPLPSAPEGFPSEGERGMGSGEPMAPRELPEAGAPRADHDHRASLRTRYAAILLDRGEDLAVVSAITGVPIALLELIRDERFEQDVHDRDVVRWQAHRTRSVKARWALVAVVLIDVVAVVNIGVCVTALYYRRADLVVLTGVVAGALVLAVWVLERVVTRP